MMISPDLLPAVVAQVMDHRVLGTTAAISLGLACRAAGKALARYGTS